MPKSALPHFWVAISLENATSHFERQPFTKKLSAMCASNKNEFPKQMCHSESADCDDFRPSNHPLRWSISLDFQMCWFCRSTWLIFSVQWPPRACWNSWTRWNISSAASYAPHSKFIDRPIAAKGEEINREIRGTHTSHPRTLENCFSREPTAGVSAGVKRFSFLFLGPLWPVTQLPGPPSCLSVAPQILILLLSDGDTRCALRTWPVALN